MNPQQRIVKAKQKIDELEAYINNNEYSDAELVCEYLEAQFKRMRAVLNQKANQQ
jgi:hypothetical protein